MAVGAEFEREKGEKGLDSIETHGMREGGRGGGVSTQWKRVSRNFPHNGSMFRALFHTMETCFALVFHGVEKTRSARLVGGATGRMRGKKR